MNKIEVTDEMVARANRATNDFLEHGVNRMRHVLEAALNPPQEPEIVVTKEMQNAANDASQVDYGVGDSKLYFAAIYRAMHAARPKECEHVWNIRWGGSGGGGRQCGKCGKTEPL